MKYFLIAYLIMAIISFLILWYETKHAITLPPDDETF